jgi:hypothetical protein
MTVKRMKERKKERKSLLTGIKTLLHRSMKKEKKTKV